MRPPSDIAAATLIAANADRARYGATAMTLHWLTALLVLTQFGLAECWGFAPRPTRHLLIVAHMSFGILLTLVLIVRIAWRLTSGHQAGAATARWVTLTSKAVHDGLYCLLAAEAVLGFLQRWSGNEAMSFLGLLIPSPFTPFSKPAHRLTAAAHDWIAWTIILLATGHGALHSPPWQIVGENLSMRCRCRKKTTAVIDRTDGCFDGWPKAWMVCPGSDVRR